MIKLKSHDQQLNHDEVNNFKQDIQLGLNKPKKQIPSKYFYDKRGSDIFNQITRHPDYYLTACELEILNQNKQKFSEMITKQNFNVIELGPGEGIKTKIILKQLLKDRHHFHYVPIDISANYLSQMEKNFKQQMPTLQVLSLNAEYLKGVEWLINNSEGENLILFLGSSIGNYTLNEAENFFQELHQLLNPNDHCLIGFDLKKDIELLIRAYNDHDGLTREFNFNLLKRINRTLKAKFNLKKFDHYPTYNVHSGAMESYLISLEEQNIHIGALNQDFQFTAFEAVHVEYSYKYLISQIEQLAKNNGFSIVENFFDSNKFFVDSLWRVV